MLNFLRKHQRIFFIVITVTIVISFSFFGTYSTFTNRDLPPDKEIVKGVAGSPIMQQELAQLCRLIESSPFDGGRSPNFLNDGVIERDFLASGLGVMLAKRYFDDLKSDLDVRVKKIHQYRTYVHPHARQINVESIWARFSPQFCEHFYALKLKSEQTTYETLTLMTQVYLDQLRMPPEQVKQVLAWQQNQQGIEADPMLAHADFSLYGFKSLEEWFGSRFISLIGQFIINSSQLAESLGYEVKTEEVRGDLFQHLYQAYRQSDSQGKLSAEEADQYFQMKMRSLGLDEPSLIGAWKKVMLFRRLFDDASGSVLVDRLSYQQFDQFAKENVRVQLYQLPTALQLTDFRSMLKFQVYLEAVAADASRLRSDLRLPRQFASLEQIEKKAPQLVERQFELEWSSVSREELARQISVKETGEWESQDAHWDLLKKNFSEVALIKANTQDERLFALDKLESKLKLAIDQFARSKMVEEQPAKIQLALGKAMPKTSTVSLRMKGGKFPFPGIGEGDELIALLHQAALKGEKPISANQRLSYYSPDGEHYYQIAILSRDEAKKILTFEEALKDGTLDQLLDQRLEDAYADVRKKESRLFQQTNGQWKPFKEVKEQIGKSLYADLLKAIEENYREEFGVLPGKAGEMPLVFYSNARLLPLMKEIQRQLQKNSEDTAGIKQDSTDASLATQWLIEKTETIMERATSVPFSKDDLFALGPQEWSPVKIGERGALAFFYVKEKGISAQAPIDSVEQGHQILAFDAKRDMMLQLLQKIDEKKSINLSYARNDER